MPHARAHNQQGANGERVSHTRAGRTAAHAAVAAPPAATAAASVALAMDECYSAARAHAGLSSALLGACVRTASVSARGCVVRRRHGATRGGHVNSATEQRAARHRPVTTSTRRADKHDTAPRTRVHPRRTHTDPPHRIKSSPSHTHTRTSKYGGPRHISSQDIAPHTRARAIAPLARRVPAHEQRAQWLVSGHPGTVACEWAPAAQPNGIGHPRRPEPSLPSTGPVDIAAVTCGVT